MRTASSTVVEGPLEALHERSRPPGAWAVAYHRRIVPLSIDQVARLFQDVPSWVLWDPDVVAADHVQGLEGQPGMVCHLTVGTRALGLQFAQVMMGTSETATVFAGGRNPGWRFIDAIRLTQVGASTEIHRRLEIQLPGPLGLLGPVVAALAGRYLHRSLSALS